MPSNFPYQRSSAGHARRARTCYGLLLSPYTSKIPVPRFPHSPPYRNEVNKKLSPDVTPGRSWHSSRIFSSFICATTLYLSGRLTTCWVSRVRPEWGLIAEFRLPPTFRPRTFSTSRLKDVDGVIEPKRSRLGNSTLTINGELRNFDPTGARFDSILEEQGQVYFDRTRYISVLGRFKKPILFLRPPRFGKSLTVNMLEHFHGLQYMDAHKSIYQVRDLSLIILACETNFLDSFTVGTRRTKRYHGWTGDARAILHLEG